MLTRLIADNIASTLGVVMTSGTTTTWHDTNNTIGTPSDITADKNINILGVVMNVDQSQTNATDDDVNSIKLIILIGLTTIWLTLPSSTLWAS
jgi:ABC-type polysaccharide/polyol phosphate transport system ATPase subunit